MSPGASINIGCVAVKIGESYLAEQFRQIAHYLAEHLIQQNDILFHVKFLTL